MSLTQKLSKHLVNSCCPTLQCKYSAHEDISSGEHSGTEDGEEVKELVHKEVVHKEDDMSSMVNNIISDCDSNPSVPRIRWTAEDDVLLYKSFKSLVSENRMKNYDF